MGIEQEEIASEELLAVNKETIKKVDEELSFLFQKCDQDNEIIAEIHRLVRKRNLSGRRN